MRPRAFVAARNCPASAVQPRRRATVSRLARHSARGVPPHFCHAPLPTPRAPRAASQSARRRTSPAMSRPPSPEPPECSSTQPPPVPPQKDPPRPQRKFRRLRTLSTLRQSLRQAPHSDHFFSQRASSRASASRASASTPDPACRPSLLGCILRSWPAAKTSRPAASHPTALSYRRWLCEVPPSSSRRHVRLPTGVHSMTATPAGGDCGFYAMAWALLHFNGPSLSATCVRRKLAQHVKQQATFYAQLLRRHGQAQSRQHASDSVSDFTRNVLMEGVHGHWLGQMWGEIELLALAKAYLVCVELYCFEVSSQSLRRYAHFEEGKRVVRLLFTGDARAGHFDALLPQDTFGRWR
ncbi:polyketide synthase family protein [Gracilaria domingensis]|nr:polyketide synthase family protein [Gracilaria domingensis]